MVSLLENKILSLLKKSQEYNKVSSAFIDRDFPIEITGIRGGFATFILSSLNRYTKENSLVVVPSEQDAITLYNDLSLLTKNVQILPWWGTMLYKGISPGSQIFGRRVDCLNKILNQKKVITIVSLRSFITNLPDPSYLDPIKEELKVGDDIDIYDIDKKLSEFGYNKVPRVTIHGEYALRGEVLDYYPPGVNEAVRVVFEFDEIEEIKFFDPVSQISTEKVKSVVIYPTKEVTWSDDRIDVLEKNIQVCYDGDSSGIINKLREFRELRGEELLYPLSFDKTYSILDYLDIDSPVYLINPESLSARSDVLDKEYLELYTKALATKMVVPAPKDVMSRYEELFNQTQRRVLLPALKQEFDHTAKLNVDFVCETGRSFFGNVNYLKEELQMYHNNGYSVFIFAESESQAERISHMLKGFNVKVIAEGISSGFILPDLKVAVIQENEIFGRRKRTATAVRKVKSQIIDSFVELNPGDYVVHVNHGIGLFKGIKRMTVAGNERDYITLLYAEEETVFIPIEQVNLVQKYIGQEGKKPKLDQIGGKSWAKKKNRVRKSVEDLADMLIQLYAKREKAVGFSFPTDDDFQLGFEASFPYQETSDQLTAISEIKADMERPKPMDRLLCGDVGFGKTEVAMRAAFKGVMGGKQVAFLCPTTILAEQHYENFIERFKQFPVKIKMLSRFVTKKDQKITLEQIESGETDIVIGTHRLLSKDVKYKKLGLVMVDEEQRFGVKDKEKLKNIKHSIDSLALSATPIPRTLHMSLVKIRDMSVLKTPPYNRQPIETFVQEFSEEVVVKAIRREVDRGGQVFFLHNRVESLDSVRLFLEKLMPEVLIETAHGQMAPTDLEDIMHRFIRGAFQVLVSTTIVENGIDIPNVNTIIIDKANTYGLSQLYQLRGRVGRSGKQAYAYLLYPEKLALSDIAMKRLQIISDFTELGAGFKIAMKDMEVRGAGNLLGREQSGEIHTVGFDMYLRLLEEAVIDRSPNSKQRAPDVYLELSYTGFIPETYITSQSEKMEIYKKIAGIDNDGELEGVHKEIYDRFGPLPEEILSLLSMAEIKIVCKELWIRSIIERKNVLDIEFGKLTAIEPDRVLRLITISKGKVRYNPSRPNYLTMEVDPNIGLKEKSEFIRDRISMLKP
ncbi:MAG: transcription-repair coupling factor [Spirochaetaceae bacterium]